MVARLVDTLGIFLYPQLLVSVCVVGICLAYAIAAARGELRGTTDRRWRHELEPLGGIAVSLGLLGSVWAFVSAFGGFAGGVDVDRIVEALGMAYTTTGVGLVTAIVASLGAYGCDLLARPPGPTDRPGAATE